MAGLFSASAAEITASTPSRLYTLNAPTAYPPFSAFLIKKKKKLVSIAVDSKVYFNYRKLTRRISFVDLEGRAQLVTTSAMALLSPTLPVT